MNQARLRPADDLLAGIGFMLAAAAIFTISDVIAKFLLPELGPVMVAWQRSLVALAVTLVFAWFRLGSRVFATRHPGIQILRGLAAFASSILFLIGLAHLPLADTVAINFAWPILGTLLSIPILGEKVGIRRWAAAAVGFAGVLLIVRPGSSAFQAAAIFPLAGALCWALSGVVTRRMMTTEAPETTLAISTLIFVVGASLLAPFFWKTPTIAQLALGAIMGLLSATAHAAVIFAFERAHVSIVAPFGYAQLVCAVLLGFLIFGTVPDAWVASGSMLIVVAGLYTAHRERIRAGQR